MGLNEASLFCADEEMSNYDLRSLAMTLSGLVSKEHSVSGIDQPHEICGCETNNQV